MLSTARRHKRLAKAWRISMLSVLLAMFMGGPSTAWGEPGREERIKAALLFKIIKFVNWPSVSSVTKMNTNNLRVCFFPDIKMGNALSELGGRQIGTRTIVIHKLISLQPSELRQCQLLYISSDGSLPVMYQGVLFVGENTDFLRRGGMIALMNNENRMAISVNPRTVRAANLEIASQLMELAEIIE